MAAQRNKNGKAKRKENNTWRKKRISSLIRLLDAISEKNRSDKANTGRSIVRNNIIRKQAKMESRVMEIWGTLGYEPTSPESKGPKTTREKWDDIFTTIAYTFQVDRDASRRLTDAIYENCSEKKPDEFSALVPVFTHLYVDQILSVLQTDSTAMAALQAKDTLSENEQCTLEVLRAQEPLLAMFVDRKKEIDAKRAAGDSGLLVMQSLYNIFGLPNTFTGTFLPTHYIYLNSTHTRVLTLCFFFKKKIEIVQPNIPKGDEEEEEEDKDEDDWSMEELLLQTSTQSSVPGGNNIPNPYLSIYMP